VVFECKDSIGAKVSNIEKTDISLGSLIENGGRENVVLDEFLKEERRNSSKELDMGIGFSPKVFTSKP
jgi:hypothetical protein